MASGPLGGLAGLRSLPSAAIRVLSVGVGFVVLVAALFAGVGAWQDRDLRADDAPAAPSPAPAPVPAPAPQDDPAADPGDDDGEGDEDPDAPDGDADAPGDGDGTGDAAPAPVGPRPQDVTVQLLNGAGEGGAAAVGRVRTQLADAGFRIAATNTGRAYDRTTVFYTVGFEAEGRLVASVLATSEVYPMTELPEDRRLSSTVMVHVVVGADRR